MTKADLDQAVQTYTATQGRAKTKRAAVMALRLAPWHIVEAELKARDLIGTNGSRVTASATTNGNTANGNGGQSV